MAGAEYKTLRVCIKKTYVVSGRSGFFFQYLIGFAVVQIPELDVSVSHCDKVGAVLGERHARHLTGHLVGSYDDIFLEYKGVSKERDTHVARILHTNTHI